MADPGRDREGNSLGERGSSISQIASELEGWAASGVWRRTGGSSPSDAIPPPSPGLPALMVIGTRSANSYGYYAIHDKENRTSLEM